MRALLVSMAIAGAALAAGCGGDGQRTSAIPSGGGGGEPPTDAAEPAGPVPAGCRRVAEAEPKPEGNRRAPRDRLDAARTWTATVETNCGRFAFRLDLEAAPRAAASFAALARSGFYDGTVFHRIAPGFVIQGGDPTGTGGGGPGYQTVDRPPRGTRYTKGVVAMAKAPAEGSGTAGSQFFVVTGDAAHLEPDYAVLGRVVRGQSAVDRIGQLGDGSEQPTFPVVIRRLRVSAR